MGKNKMENFIFTALVCFFMILGMSSYNSILKHGFNSLTWSSFFVTLLRLFYAVYLFSNGVSPFNEECGLLEL